GLYFELSDLEPFDPFFRCHFRSSARLPFMCSSTRDQAKTHAPPNMTHCGANSITLYKVKNAADAQRISFNRFTSPPLYAAAGRLSLNSRPPYPISAVCKTGIVPAGLAYGAATRTRSAGTSAYSYYS